MHRLLIVAATGGLGSAVVREALSRGLSVSVLVRSRAKLDEVLGKDVARLAAVHVGSASDEAVVRSAVEGTEVVVSAVAPDAAVAAALAKASKEAGAKLVWTAGGSNILEADGVTLHYKAFGEQGEAFYRAHTPCIEAVKATGVTYIIWCPGVMKSGQRSSPQPRTLLRADPAGLAAWDYISYEDAAQVIVSACEASEFDNQHISALSPPPPKAEL